MLYLGWASRDMTPTRPILLDGQFASRVSTHVNDPLMVAALAIETRDGSGAGDCAILVSCDLVSVPDRTLQLIRDAAHERLPDLDAAKVVTNATHTHTGPILREGRYPQPEGDVMTPAEGEALVVERAADAIVEAWEQRKPGGLSWAFGHAVVGHNRRAAYLDGSARMYGKTHQDDFDSIEGYEDHSMDMLFTWDDRSELTGVVVNLACPSQVTEGARYVSADFWHETRVELRKRLGADTHILTQCAAAGDQSPHFLLYKGEEEYMRRRRGLTEREEIARRIAAAVEEALQGAREDIRTDLACRHVVEPLDLPVRKITEQEFAQAKEEYERLLAQREQSQEFTTSDYTRLMRAKGVLTRCEAQETNPWFKMELHVIRLGDIVLATNPFELFLDFGLRIKARSNAPQTFIVQLACGRGVYLPTEKAIKGGHYGAGAADNLVGPEGGQVIVDRTVGVINRMFPAQGTT